MKYPPIKLLKEARPDEFLNMFGKAEVEWASSVIAAKVRKKGKWSWLEITLKDFDDKTQRGFLLMLSRGWLQEAYCHTCCFDPTPEWAHRIIKLQGIDPSVRHLAKL